MADVFISYAHEDRARVEKLVLALETYFSVWWDGKMLAGQHIGEETPRHLNAAKAVVVVWSNFSIQSNWVRGEANRAGRRLIPVKISPVDPPIAFDGLLVADLVDWRGGSGSHAGFELAVNSIRALLAQSAPAIVAPPAIEPPRSLPKQPAAAPRARPREAVAEVRPVPLVAWAVWLAVGLLAAVVALYYLTLGGKPVVAVQPQQQPAVAQSAVPKPIQMQPAQPAPMPEFIEAADTAAALARTAADDAKAKSDAAMANANTARAAAGATFGWRDTDRQPGIYTGQRRVMAGRPVPDGLGFVKFVARGHDDCPAGIQTHYDGSWTLGQRSGLGVMFRCNGGSYSGEFQSDLPDGSGVSTDKLGNVYAGIFHKRVAHLGVKTGVAGNPVLSAAGYWGEHDLDGYAVVTCADGFTWKGAWKDGALAGPGAAFDKDGYIVRQGVYGLGQPDGEAPVCGIAH